MSSSPLSRSFDKLCTLFQDMLKIKNETNGDPAELAETRKQALLLFVLIKKLNRTDKYGIRTGREALHNTKVQVDSNRLQLQNLLYEVGYLRREIRRCYQFKSQDEDIDLLTEMDYLTALKQEAPIATTKHQKRLLRLESELNLRKQLSVQCKDLSKSKKQVEQEIVMKVERLNSFAPSLQTLVRATRSLQDALQTPLDREWRIARLVQLLPQPLYVAYMNIHALEHVTETDVSVVILGTEKDVHHDELMGQFNVLENGSGNSGGDGEEDRSSGITRFSKNSRSGGVHNFKENGNLDGDDARQRLLSSHALIVQFIIGAKEKDNILINLRYFPLLGIVTATNVMQLEELGEYGELAGIQDILKTLYDNDLGDSIPVAKAEHVLLKIGMTPEECLRQFTMNGQGKPYIWAQRICCIETFQLNNRPTLSSSSVAGTKVQAEIGLIVKRLQEVWNSRLNLLKQIKALMNKNTDLYLKNEQLPLSHPPACSLVQWTSIGWEEYSTNVNTASYINDCASDIIDASHIFYRAIVVRGSAKMECIISVSNKFPIESPLWIISIHWNGREHCASNSAAIKQMEYWTNSVTQQQLQNSYAILAFQLYHTMYSFDIFLETEGPLHTPVEYRKEKNYIKAFAKRSRARPYRFIQQGITSTFKQ